MEKILIMTDSNASISQEEAKNLHIYIVPMPFIINGEEFYEGINIQEDEFLSALRKGAKISTSQPSSFLLEEIFTEELKKYDSEDIFVIGGESIYRQLLDECDKAYITKIDYAYTADAYFPNLDEKEEWKITAESEEHTCFDLEYFFLTYEKNA